MLRLENLSYVTYKDSNDCLDKNHEIKFANL